MFGMEPSVQLQEYSTKFFHTIKPQKKNKIPYVTVTWEAGLKYTKAKKIQSAVETPSNKINMVS